jgi:hypothetical protein
LGRRRCHCPSCRDEPLRAVVGGIVATNRFGFMTMERAGAGWRAIARDVAGAPMTTCVLADRHADCAPTGWLGGGKGAGY